MQDEIKTGSLAPAKTVREFSENNGISVRQAYDEINEGRLKAKKLGTRTLILPEDEEAWRRSLADFIPGSSRPIGKARRVAV
jgi:hypothetical protein